MACFSVRVAVIMLMYCVVHCAEIRGQIRFCDVATTPRATGSADLSGAQQVPAPVSSLAQGLGVVTLLADGSGVSVSLSLTNIQNQTAAHIHAGGALQGT